MDFQDVDSSSIREVGHDEEDEVLGVIFNSGILYHYKGVSKEKFEEMVAAPSVGKFLNEEIKDVFDCENMGPA